MNYDSTESNERKKGSQSSRVGSKFTMKSILRDISDFEIAGNKIIGEGSYGQVKLVKDRETGRKFAMKIIKKKSLVSSTSVQNIKREIKIHSKLVHQHIVKLYYFFEDEENVYMILSYAENGSLYQYLRNRGKLSEKEAFVYFSQTSLGLDFLHKKDIIHRDLKPENLLLDKRGNIKICDFGWSAKMVKPSRTTMCGTVDYMAPEMLYREAYTTKIDIWALGILLYEMLHGDAPYGEDTPMGEKIDMIKGDIPIVYNEKELSKEVLNLLGMILQRDPKKRCSMREIFDHPWMKKNEASYDIDIESFVTQNSREASRKSVKTDVSLQSIGGGSQRSIFSTMSTTEETRKRKYKRFKVEAKEKEALDGIFDKNSQTTRRIGPFRALKPKILPKEENTSIWSSFLQKLGCMKRPEISNRK